MGRAASASIEPLPRNGRPSWTQPSGHGRQSGCLHPLQPVRPRLPRSAGQRRHRHGRSRRTRPRSFSISTTRWGQHLRRLRRMRAGLPDRRADASHLLDDRCGTAHRPHSRQRLPLLRRRLPAHLQSEGRASSCRQGRKARPIRNGSASRAGSALTTCTTPPPDQAADPQGRRRQDADDDIDPGEPADPFSGKRPGRKRWKARRGLQTSATNMAATPWPDLARQRARTKKPICSRNWCGPAFGTNNVDHCTRLCHASRSRH